ncbi:MAG: DUF1553 domain-containing protein [Planctomycetaceae bacterium]
MKSCIATVLAALVMTTGLSASPPTAADPLDIAGAIDFVRDVRPIFQTHCDACHGAHKQKSGLRLDIKSEALRGGDHYGPIVIAGDADSSPLMELVTSEDADSRMPPETSGLSQKEIAILRTWIQQGAVWPDGVDLAKLEDRTDHWSFKPLARPTSDSVDAGPAAIDGFVLRKLAENGLSMSPPADRLTWLRRVYFDLIGLPPSPEQVAAFLNDDSPLAYARVVDQLLSSPRHGERWAQHWLDVVRYADTDGFEVNTPRPHAWPYRDYVIRALNEDRPYDRFIREQLTGDALNEDAATGFLVTAAALLPGQIGKDEASMRLARQDELAEIIINTSEAFLGLSIGCARCHDHKFDAISHRDYYSLQAFFSGVRYGERPIRSPESDARQQAAESLQRKADEIDRQVTALLEEASIPRTDPQKNVESFAAEDARFVRFTVHDANRHPSLGLIEPCIDEFEIFAADDADLNLALAESGTKVTASGSRTSKNHRLEYIHDGQYGNGRSWMSDRAGQGWVQFELPRLMPIEKVIWSRDREGRFDDRLATAFTLEVGPRLDAMKQVAGLTREQAEAIARLRKVQQPQRAKLAELQKIPMVFAGNFTTPDPTHLLSRGDPEQPLDEVSPAVPAALGKVSLPSDAPDAARRQALAEWIADADHPLTARVMVNRIWQWHFGTGLVETASDFGRSGARPTHPELLDWLAGEFIDHGWSIKHMHRLIVLSATYRQSSQHDAGAMVKDADARLLWRFPSRRLEAEAIRDSMLAVSGRLNLDCGGPGFDLFKSRGGLSGFPPIESFGGEGLRRMIYAHKVRMEREAVFGAFDCPDAGQSMAKRRQSTTPLQALNLFNSRFTIEEAEAFAARIEANVGDDPQAQLRAAYELAFGRSPEPEDLHDALPVIREHGLATVCRVIFNSNEFLFVP